jgi:hypothetical protein
MVLAAGLCIRGNVAIVVELCDVSRKPCVYKKGNAAPHSLTTTLSVIPMPL